jgi:hypothetical protein
MGNSMEQGSAQKRLGWPSWQLIAALLVVVSGGIGFTATSLLLRSPKSPNCARIYWPIASAAMRLYCAQVEADQKTVKSLLKAITLAEELPTDHPLRSQVDQNVENWASEILNLAEDKFQAGQIEEAISIAEQIPSHVKAYKLVEERINNWRMLWAKAEEIYQAAEKQLRSAQWNDAFRSAVSLTYLSNQYWANVKYTEVVDKIQIAREESSKLDNAYAALRRGDIDNILKAIEEAQKINKDSYAYKEAQDLIDDSKNRLLKRAQTYLKDQNWARLSELANRMPSSLQLQEEVIDWQNISSAGLRAKEGTVFALETAIVEASKIESDRPIYSDARNLITYWQQEVEGLKHLDKAKEIAGPGTAGDLAAAIAQAQLVSTGNPRYQEAQNTIKDWNQKIQTMEDQPLLTLAREMARGGSIPALQQAISQASQIGANRPLHQDAQNEIIKWRTSIERQQDQPLLDQAIVLSTTRDYPGAIKLAQSIQPGRALYNDAQTRVKSWQAELDGRERLEEAYQIASPGTPEALSRAIRTARRVPSGTETRPQSIQAINRWSYQLLAFAQEQSKISLSQGIAIAEMIPSGTSAYEATQSQLRVWRDALNPPARVPLGMPETIEVENSVQ